MSTSLKAASLTAVNPARFKSTITKEQKICPISYPRPILSRTTISDKQPQSLPPHTPQEGSLQQATKVKQLDCPGEVVPQSFLSRQFPEVVSLGFEQLANFDVVTQQFLGQGVIFTNAIAIQPSNPAFSPLETGSMTLMGAPKPGVIDAVFIEPVGWVEVCFKASRAIVLIAFDQANQMLSQVETDGSNLGDESDGNMLPHSCLKLELGSSVIHRVLLRCSGGQITVSHFKFK